jgi:hypothetical protein
MEVRAWHSFASLVAIVPVTLPLVLCAVKSVSVVKGTENADERGHSKSVTNVNHANFGEPLSVAVCV